MIHEFTLWHYFNVTKSLLFKSVSCFKCNLISDAHLHVWNLFEIGELYPLDWFCTLGNISHVSSELVVSYLTFRCGYYNHTLRQVANLFNKVIL